MRSLMKSDCTVPYQKNCAQMRSSDSVIRCASSGSKARCALRWSRAGDASSRCVEKTCGTSLRKAGSLAPEWMKRYARPRISSVSKDLPWPRIPAPAAALAAASAAATAAAAAAASGSGAAIASAVCTLTESISSAASTPTDGSSRVAMSSTSALATAKWVVSSLASTLKTACSCFDIAYSMSSCGFGVGLSWHA